MSRLYGATITTAEVTYALKGTSGRGGGLLETEENAIRSLPGEAKMLSGKQRGTWKRIQMVPTRARDLHRNLSRTPRGPQDQRGLPSTTDLRHMEGPDTQGFCGRQTTDMDPETQGKAASPC